MHGLTNPDQGVLKGVVAGKVISGEFKPFHRYGS
jgi:hypothetical protein